MEQLEVLALHGFLGQSSDWDFIKPSFQNFTAPDLFKEYSPHPKSFTDFVTHAPKANILMGYSLGGRLGLHLLKAHPNNFKAAVFISTHFGLTDRLLKLERSTKDQSWAARFLVHPWEKLMHDWNNQKVFLTHSDKNTPLNRHESEFSRLHLSRAMLHYSLGEQEYFVDWLNNAEIPILWVVGSLDQDYVTRAKHLKTVKTVVIEGAGHRVWNDQPVQLKDKILEFLETVK